MQGVKKIMMCDEGNLESRRGFFKEFKDCQQCPHYIRNGNYTEEFFVLIDDGQGTDVFQVHRIDGGVEITGRSDGDYVFIHYLPEYCCFYLVIRPKVKQSFAKHFIFRFQGGLVKGEIFENIPVGDYAKQSILAMHNRDVSELFGLHGMYCFGHGIFGAERYDVVNHNILCGFQYGGDTKYIILRIVREQVDESFFFGFFLHFPAE
jgi:hypothetical protein